jgi:hypothetical protein
MYFGVTGVAAPKAASSRTARYSSTARPTASGGRPAAVDGAPVPAGVRADQAGVDGEALAADQALGHAPPDHALEELAQQIALAEAAVPVLGEGRVVRYVAIQAQAAEPAVGQVEVDLLAEPPLRADAQAVAHQQHPDHQLGIDRGPADRAVERGQVRPHALQVHEAVDGAEQMGLRDAPLQRELVEQLRLIDPPLAHHARALPPQQE